MTTQSLLKASESQQQPELCLAQHPVLRITLTGHGIFLTIIAIVISIQILQPSLTCTLIILSPLPWIIMNDYTNFISLGPGGTPSTFFGYLKICFLRLFALSDPYTPVCFTGKIYPEFGYYQRAPSWLPKRRGPRPTIAGIAPQRQLDQTGCPHMYSLVCQFLTKFANTHSSLLRTGISCFEKKGLALFCRIPINATCRGEIAHVHSSDRSLHLNLHPDDARVVLEQGWGERHPLAKGGWMTKYVPREFVMVYAPRDREECEVVLRIIEAACWWVSGERLEVSIGREEKEEREGCKSTVVPDVMQCG
ncbi:hypothetical protein BJ878DRAFT_415101 [Calycina marina]|uniref:Luciferase domain-containing protein n=1 Tax=Calycina marina TaxID=1763456 RepID=A0A9P8CJA6_9HELO|nr:hypothetical protein BJ878DRAFT_415101 [Calycina marina]